MQSGKLVHEEVNSHVDAAHIILFLISVDLLNSDEYETDIEQVLQRSTKDEITVVFILLRPSHWKDQHFEHALILPYNQKPVTRWPNRDDAWKEIAENLQSVVWQVKIKQYLLEARKQQEEQNYETSLQRYDEALKLLEKLPIPDQELQGQAYTGKTETLYQQQNYPECIATIQKAERIQFTRNGMFYQLKAAVLNEVGQLEESLIAYQKSLAFSPQDARLYCKAIDILLQLQRPHDALQVLRKALQLRLDVDLPTLVQMGGVAFEQGNFAEAQDLYGRAIELRRTKQRPEDAGLFENRGKAYEASGDFKQALQDYQQASNLAPETALYYRRQGWILFTALHDLQRAESMYRSAIKYEPDNPYQHKIYADILTALKRYPEALTAYEQAIKCKTDYRKAYESKSVALRTFASELERQAQELKRQAQEAEKQAKALNINKNP